MASSSATRSGFGCRGMLLTLLGGLIFLPSLLILTGAIGAAAAEQWLSAGSVPWLLLSLEGGLTLVLLVTGVHVLRGAARVAQALSQRAFTSVAYTALLPLGLILRLLLAVFTLPVRIIGLPWRRWRGQRIARRRGDDDGDGQQPLIWVGGGR